MFSPLFRPSCGEAHRDGPKARAHHTTEPPRSAAGPRVAWHMGYHHTAPQAHLFHDYVHRSPRRHLSCEDALSHAQWALDALGASKGDEASQVRHRHL